MKKYIEAELEVIRFDAEDVIATSCVGVGYLCDSYTCDDCDD